MCVCLCVLTGTFLSEGPQLLSDSERYLSPSRTPSNHYCKAMIYNATIIVPLDITVPLLIILGSQAGHCTNTVRCKQA